MRNTAHNLGRFAPQRQNWPQTAKLSPQPVHGRDSVAADWLVKVVGVLLVLISIVGAVQQVPGLKSFLRNLIFGY